MTKLFDADEQAKLARLACLLVSARLAGGQPS